MAPIVDSHLHIWSDDRDRYPRADTPYRASVELLLDYLDEAGVDHAVIVLPMYYRYDNRVLADTLKQHPGRFAGVGVLDPREAEAADRLNGLVADDGIRGVRLRATIEEEYDVGAGEGTGEAPGWALRHGDDDLSDLIAPLEVALDRAEALRFPGLGDRATVQMRLNGQSREAVEEWLAAAHEQLTMLESES